MSWLVKRWVSIPEVCRFKSGKSKYVTFVIYGRYELACEQPYFLPTGKAGLEEFKVCGVKLCCLRS